MKQLFGTDGIRGHAGDFPLDARTVAVIGASLARQFRDRLGRDPRFISGRDTRESGAAIEAAFHAGAATENSTCESVGVITTPGVAYLTSEFNFDAGIVVSASHNPYEDNGIKIFLPSGQKIDEATERAIESDIYAGSGVDIEATPIEEHAARTAELCTSYTDHIMRVADGFSADGMRIVLDCANGAAAAMAPGLFARTGADVISINVSPDGRNINKDCGSLHLEELQAKVVETGADMGVAFDGDADRALFADEKGNVIDGDATLWILAQNLRLHGKLANSTVVATVMSNIGLELALKGKGIDLLRTNVGDKYVLEKLIETGSEIGGEQSGHIIFPEISFVGDGMMTAMLLLRSIREKETSLSQAAGGFVRFPQTLKNVKVREKRPFADVPEIMDSANQVELELHGEGRLLLRYSGTENLARVMIEGQDQTVIDAQANRIADAIMASLG
ncbi:MAG: phosphoglucosamine mutase [Pyrinomonadaceae bacterium]